MGWWWFAACSHKGLLPVTPEELPDSADPAVAGVHNAALRSVLAEHWQATMSRFPEWATELGDHRYDDRITDPSDDAVREWLALESGWALRLQSLPDATLDPTDRVTRELLLEQLRADAATAVCRTHLWNVSARSNPLVRLTSLADDARLDTAAAGQAFLQRLRAVPASIEAQMANLRAGLASGRVENRESVEKVVAMFDRELASPVEAARAVERADAELSGWSAAEAEAFRAEVRVALTEGVRPALARYRDLLRDEVLPRARTGGDIGLHALPDGEACYEALIRRHVTVDRDADELHRVGLEELAKIHGELRELGRTALGTDDLAQIVARLRADPALHFTTAEEVEATAEQALRRAEAAAPRWFARLPSAPCEVEPIPAYIAPYTTIAYYEQVRPDGSRPGIYFVNVYAPETRPRFEAEVLAFHESVPGHHLQIAYAQELGALPAFRRYDGASVFVEGWALYVERLAEEMGLYTSDLDRIGMLSFDAWRASRLVVDTGVHALGWSREEAERFMLENTPLAENNVVNEVDRYVTWPGQALAYKTGQLEIRALRAQAEAELGPAFALPEFHDVVLGGGAVTLPVLRDRVERWIATEVDATGG